MSILVASLVILLYAIVFAAFFKRSVCETLIPAVICPVFLLYLFGLLNFKGCLIIGVISISILAIILTVFVLKKHGFRSLILETELFTGAAVFAVLVIVAFIMNFNMRIHIWDEFNHWGMRLKYMFLYNALPIYTEPGAWNLNPMCFYPPATAILSYLFSFTGFSEWKALFSQQLFLLLLLTPFIKDIFKQGKWFFSVLFFSMFFLFFGAVNAYATLYVDSLLGILFGFAVVYYLRFMRNNDSFGLFITTCIVSMIALTKDVGFLLSMGVCILILFDGIIFTQKDGTNRLNHILRCLPVIAATLFFYMSWIITLKKLGIAQLATFDIKQLPILFSRGILEDWRRIVRWRIVFEILPKTPIGLIFKKMSYMVIVFLFFVFGVIYSIANGFKRNILWVSIMTIGAGFYAFFLLWLNVLIADEYTGSQVHSYHRYSLSYLLSMPIIIFVLIYPMRQNFKISSVLKFINVQQTEKDFTLTVEKFTANQVLFIILAFLIIMRSLPFTQFLFITNRELFKPSSYEEARKFIPFINDGELLQIITPGRTGSEWQQVRYQLVAHNVNTLDWQEGRFSVGEKPYFYFPTFDDPFTFIVNSEEWGDWLNKNGFKKMLLWDPTPEFIESYSSMFPGGIKPHTLYRIMQNGSGGVYFEEVVI